MYALTWATAGSPLGHRLHWSSPPVPLLHSRVVQVHLLHTHERTHMGKLLEVNLAADFVDHLLQICLRRHISKTPATSGLLVCMCLCMHECMQASTCMYVYAWMYHAYKYEWVSSARPPWIPLFLRCVCKGVTNTAQHVYVCVCNLRAELAHRQVAFILGIKFVESFSELFQMLLLLCTYALSLSCLPKILCACTCES